MQDTFRPTSYGFFTELTDRISALVQNLRRSEPEALRYRGMDFSHVLECWLYFSLTNEEPLHRLYETQGATSAIALSPPAAFLAAAWFGGRAIRQRRSFRQAFTDSVRPLRVFAGRGFSRRAAPLGGAYDLLLYSASLRLARYMMPVADAWTGRCAFLVNHADRALQDELSAAGYRVETFGPAGPGWRRAGRLLARFTPGLCLLADEIEQALLATKARVVILPEGNAPDDEVINLVGHRLGVKIACLQQGWSPLIHSGFRNMHYDSMLVWGQGFVDLLKPYNPNQHFSPVGNHMLLENSGPPAGARNGIAIFSMGTGLWLQPEDEDLLLSLAVELARRLPGNTIYVRPHPRHPFSERLLRDWVPFSNIRVATSPEFSLAEVLAQSRAAVSVYSSTILESIGSGTVPVVFNMTTMPRFMPDVGALGAGIEVHTFSEAGDALTQLMANPEAADIFVQPLASFRRSFFMARGQAAVCNIVAELERLARLSAPARPSHSG